MSSKGSSIQDVESYDETVSRGSNTAGWQRGLDKYSPSKETMMSPIKSSEANLKHVIRELTDPYVDIFTWIVNMSEQYYYDNAFLSLSFSRRNSLKMSTILRRSFVGVDMKFFNNLRNIVFLGQGSYGAVFGCEDPQSNLKYAIKLVTPDNKSMEDEMANVIGYMAERNSVIQSTGSVFVVKFYYSLQIKPSGVLFLFFEWCVGDLDRFIDFLGEYDQPNISMMLYENEIDIIDNLFFSKEHFLEVVFIYIFEMFCGLDFLVQCNLVHQDIKPDNIMISSSLHLKIGDFGLAHRARTIHRNSNNMLVKSEDINNLDALDYKQRIAGSPLFRDIESNLSSLKSNDYKEFSAVIDDMETFDTPGIILTPEILEPTFLVDTWAVAVSALELLFRGFDILDPDGCDESILMDVPRTFPLYLIHLIGRKSIYTKYIRNGLVNAGGRQNEELMAFIASIFKPRSKRCLSYTKEKEIYNLKRRERHRYVDIDKIEQLNTFSGRHFSKSNIHLRLIDPIISQLFRSKKKPIFHRFSDLLKYNQETVMKEKYPTSSFIVDPGVTINFFD